MSEATNNATTLNLPSRRGIAGGGPVMLVLAAAAVGSAKEQELDGELLSLYREFCANRHEVAGMWDGDEPPYLGDPRIDRECDLADRYLRIVEKLAALPAKTPEGLQAKAAVVLADFRGEDDLEHYPDQYDPRSALAMSLARDITRRAVV